MICIQKHAIGRLARTWPHMSTTYYMLAEETDVFRENRLETTKHWIRREAVLKAVVKRGAARAGLWVDGMGVGK